MTIAVVVGSNGQDGRLLVDCLKSDGYQVIGISSNGIQGKFKTLLNSIDICNSHDVDKLLKISQPDEIYYLAAFHHSSENVPLGDAVLYRKSHCIHVEGLLNFLDGIKKITPKTRIFYATSSHIFGSALVTPQDEQTPINPNSLYGITKASGFQLIKYYRESCELFACSGILYNHESPLRTQNFVSQKIITTAINIKRGYCSKLVIGDLKATVDWGYAPDYVLAMKMILNSNYPDDYIISTGIKHTVQDFIEITFEFLGLDWRKFISEDNKIIARKTTVLVGNSDKLRKIIQWKPSIELRQMIYILIKAKGGFDE